MVALQMDEKSFNTRYNNVIWNKIASDNNISDAAIMSLLQMEEGIFNATYPDSRSDDRTPMMEDFTDEQKGSESSEYDEKLMLAARALRDEAVLRGSGDNIVVCVADLLGDNGLWHSLSWFQKAGVCTLSAVAIAAFVGVLYSKFVR